LDCICLFEFGAKPLMELDDIKSFLPCQDEVWENQENSFGGMNATKLTLLDAMELMYMEKKLPPHLSEFSTALLVNAIYRHTHTILRRERNPLSFWTPSAIPQQVVSSDRSDDYGWFPANPTTHKWRNSACDSLDILHWPANSKVAQLSGTEHHIILHLHLARLIILTPTECIRTLATSLVMAYRASINLGTSKAANFTNHEILQWTIRDQCKARLSIVHCGALYWHVRRYSRNSILEPYAIYIATLVLWAFCTSMQLPEVLDNISQDTETDPEPQFLHLDRPVDDELVQTFVRAGHKMSAHMSRIGNILTASAPAKILREGISLLEGGSRVVKPGEANSTSEHGRIAGHTDNHTWGIEESYVVLLRDLLLATTDSVECSEP
jgi:hypothetical protein